MLRGTGIREKVFDVFASCAIRHRLETATASALLLAVQKTEQLASIVAEMAQFSEQTYKDDALVILTAQCDSLMSSTVEGGGLGDDQRQST